MNAKVSLVTNRADSMTADSKVVHSKPFEVADLLVAYLEQIGVEYVFGVPGGAIEPLFNALGRSARRGGIRHILSRHESGAAFMADGYARETGKLGVCCSTSGPGATNLITGVASAYANNIPMLVITGQTALPSFGKNPLQESSCTGIDTLGMFRHCTHYNSLVSHPEQIEAKLISALQSAVRTPGPSHLTFPVDVFRSPSPHPVPLYDLPSLLAPSSLVDNGAVDTLCEMLAQARNVVILIGSGCGEAIGSILQFAAAIGASFVTTPDGKGLVNPRHPLFRGVFGFGGHASAETALGDRSVDMILAVGTGMGEWNSGGWCESLLNERLAHIDESEEHLAQTPMARIHIRGRILSVFNRMNERQREQRQDDDNSGCHPQYVSHGSDNDECDPRHLLAAPNKYDSEATPIKPQRLMRELGTRFPTTTRFLADTGNSVAWAIHYLHPGADRRFNERRLGGDGRKIELGQRKTTGGWLRVIMDFAAMGWAIGGAVGTAAANPDVPVVCITGDGSMLMNGQEISVAVAEKLCVIFVVLNDGALGMVKHGQRLAGAEQTGYELPPTDFAALARALGATAHIVRSPEDLSRLDITAMCEHQGPTLLDVLIDPDEIPPMNVRMRVLTSSL